MRTHVVVPDELIEKVDRLVGKRRRSAFISAAVQERVRRENLLRAMREAAGSIKAEDHPEWADSKNVAAWVRRLRRESNRRLEKLYGRVPPR